MVVKLVWAVAVSPASLATVTVAVYSVSGSSGRSGTQELPSSRSHPSTWSPDSSLNATVLISPSVSIPISVLISASVAPSVGVNATVGGGTVGVGEGSGGTNRAGSPPVQPAVAATSNIKATSSRSSPRAGRAPAPTPARSFAISPLLSIAVTHRAARVQAGAADSVTVTTFLRGSFRSGVRRCDERPVQPAPGVSLVPGVSLGARGVSPVPGGHAAAPRKPVRRRPPGWSRHRGPAYAGVPRSGYRPGRPRSVGS